MYGYIYKTTDLVNNEIYIGRHKSNIFDPKYFGSGIIIKNLIAKYGTDTFICELIEECNNEDELNDREKFWIAYFNATDRSIGYNLMSGGYKTEGLNHSEETKRKISNSKKGCHPKRDYVVSEATRNKISNTLKEYYKTHDNPRKGAILSPETKKITSS